MNMKLVDADELMEHVWRDKLDSRELIAKMIEQAPPVKEIPIKISIDILEKLVSQEFYKDCISRQAALSMQYKIDDSATLSTRNVVNVDDIEDLPPVNPQPKIGHCKDCRWWKDSDGVYRRGVGAESQCHINCREVYEGNGYCFMFAAQERSDEE